MCLKLFEKLWHILTLLPSCLEFFRPDRVASCWLFQEWLGWRRRWHSGNTCSWISAASACGEHEQYKQHKHHNCTCSARNTRNINNTNSTNILQGGKTVLAVIQFFPILCGPVATLWSDHCSSFPGILKVHFNFNDALVFKGENVFRARRF